MRRLCFALLMMSAAPMAAQDRTQTLADIRAELGQVFVEIQSLRRELSTTGTAGLNTTQAPALQRLDVLEAEVRRLTGALEQKDFQIQDIVRDGTNRIGDLAFRLCELEEGCDPFTMDKERPLGDIASPSQPVATSQTPGTAPTSTEPTTASERQIYDRAMTAFQGGDFLSAADQFQSVVNAFPQGPLSGEALYWRGEALLSLGDVKGAARSFLRSFSDYGENPKAPDALFKLGTSLDELGQTDEACVMFTAVGERFPSSGAAIDAQTEALSRNCP